MIVVPLKNDIVVTTDGNELKVVEYTNYKSTGPAVYTKIAGSSSVVLVYFADIVSINGTKVEYSQSAKVFNGLGHIKRKQQLPQPNDMIKILINEITSRDDDDELNDVVKVIDVRLQVKSAGVNKGMLIKDSNKNYYRLNQILDVYPDVGADDFNRTEFLGIYKDYTGV